MYQVSRMHVGIPTLQRQGSGDALGDETRYLARPIIRRQRGKREAESGREHGTILLLTGGVKHGSEAHIQYPGTGAQAGLNGAERRWDEAGGN
jgi:hypothetical protein